MPTLPYSVEPELLNKARTLKLALFDVDGILTDGSLYYGANGESLKRFNVLDGHGLKMLRNHGVEVGIISAKQSAPLTARLNDLQITHQLTGISNKLAAYTELVNTLGIPTTHTSFMGDDVIDIPVMQACGLSFSVENAHYSVKAIADWTTPMSGGSGAVRAVCDIIVHAKKQ